ncbi:MAG: cell division protein FtsQ/DivIB [Gammaproteobacteria bacterium]|nr:cell division protein FtsQ/DivIB [Gammaproteobacteria bacterium]
MKWLKRRKKNAVKREPREPRQVLRPALWALAAVGVIAAGVFGWQAIREAGLEEFRALQITGELENVQPADVREALAPMIERGFVNLDIAAAREAIESLPWVHEAAVRRQWPGILAVEIFEQHPVATWYGTALLNREGDVFIDGAAGYSGVLPDLTGPAGSQEDLLQELANVRQQLDGVPGLELRRLLQSERRAERFWLANGLEVRLGRHDTDARLARFIKVAWPVLRLQAERVAYVDMRYDNGFAVGWKQSTANPVTSGDETDVQENG